MQKADPDWTAYLVSTIRDFVVGGMPPVGVVDRAKAEWLVHVLAADKGTKAARSITRSVMEQACRADDALLLGLRRSRPAAVRPEMGEEVAHPTEKMGVAPEAITCEQPLSTSGQVSPPLGWASSLSTSVNQIAA